MMIEAQWKALETEAHGPDDGRWRLRLARPIGGHPLYAAVFAGRRALLLRTAAEAIPPRSHWPSCTGLETLAVTLDSHTYLGVALQEVRFVDVFSALAEDLARQLEATPESPVAVFIGQLRRWQRFLASKLEGLDAVEQRGLWGELHLLQTLLLPALGPDRAVSGWKGPEHAHQDFQYATAWVEVKTTLAKQPQAVRINSERQLDDSLAPALFLHVIALEAQAAGTDTLPFRVATLRSTLAGAPAARETFENALLAVGYHDRDEPRYATTGYAVRRTHLFRIAPGFPRLIESQLCPGVGDVSYLLDVAACSDFAASPTALIAALNGLSSTSASVEID